MIRNPFILILLGLGLLGLLYQTKAKGPVMYLTAIMLYGLVVVNFSEIQSQISGALHPNKKVK